MSLLNFLRKKITVATHGGTFHADDVFAVAVLQIWAERNDLRLEVLRTRERKILETVDIVVDVGEEYDPDKNRFDHHQKESPRRESGIPYAALGLIWKHYGAKICGPEVAERMDRSLVLPIDARDNGIVISTQNHLGIVDHRTSNAITDFTPTWQEPAEIMPGQFRRALRFAVEILQREIKWAEAEIEGNKITRRAIKEQDHPEVLVLDKNVEYEEEVSKDKNIKFVITPGNKYWKLRSARDDLESYENRVEMPESWRGLRDEDLQKASGISEAMFCAKGGWYGTAQTREAALEMARKSLRAN